MPLQIIGGDWFAEQHESATNPKGFAEILQGKLLIEISEMDSFNRTEVNRVKQTVSCPSDRYRPSYGHHAQDHLRQCIFVGTTNRDDYGNDDTGLRRFLPGARVFWLPSAAVLLAPSPSHQGSKPLRHRP